MAARPDGARRPMSQQARSTARGRTAAILPGARSSRALRTGSAVNVQATASPVRATMRADDRTTVRSERPLAGLTGAARRPPWRGRPGRSPTAPSPTEPPTAGSLLLGWTFAAAPDARHRGRRRSGGCGRSAGSTRPTRHNPVPRRRTVAFLAGMLALAFALISGIERYDTTPLLGPHGPARPADARRRAAAGAGRADHAGPAAELAGDAPALAPPGPPLAGRPVPRPPGRRLGDVRGDDVGDPFLAAVQRVARGPADPRPRARRCS